MKTILAIETSTRHGSVALLRGNNILFEREFVADRSHNSLVFEALEPALTASVPDLIVVGTGPGSYSGVRVGLAAGIGFSLARNVPLMGWPSLCGFAMPPRCQVVGDARRGQFFLADLEDGRLIAEPALLSLDGVRARLVAPCFTFDEDPLTLTGVKRASPSAMMLAQAVSRITEAELAAASTAIPQPIYLRAPFITTPKARVNRNPFNPEP